MPEFVLDSTGDVTGKEFTDLDAFTQGYIEALFFTNSSCFSMVEWAKPEVQKAVAEGQSDGEVPGDAGFSDLYPPSLVDIMNDCATFQRDHVALLAQAYARDDYSEIQAGRDYWFTRNGHGVGFWDRTQLDADGLGDALSKACENQEVNASFGAVVDGSESPTGYGWVIVE